LDQSKLSEAIGHAFEARERLREKAYSAAMKEASLACDVADQLYNERKEKAPNMQVVLAPFYFLMADALTTYI